MKRAKHTPGPWDHQEIILRDNIEWVRIVSPDNTHAICDVPQSHARDLANARLIRLAPELLRALISAIKTYGDTCLCDECPACLERQNFEELIARATGGAE